jgi:O-antigen biosynthesis protein
MTVERTGLGRMRGGGRRTAQRSRPHRLLFRLRWRHIPAGWRYLRHHGLAALLRRLFPELRGYRSWIKRYDTLTGDDRRRIADAIARLVDPPLISVIMPVYQTPERYLRAAIEAVCRQLYPHWQLCIADDASPSPHVGAVIEEYRARDRRIAVCCRHENGHISAASNSALALADGDFVALLDHDDVLPEHALYMVAAALAERPDLDLIFSDEDKIDAQGKRFAPYFKSDWNPDLMLSQNAFSHLGVYRRSLVEAVGGFRLAYEGSQDYDLVLRASARTTPERIAHIPHILYHWRAVPGSAAMHADAKTYAIASARRAVADHLAQRGIAATVGPGASPIFHRVRYALPEPAPGVSLIIPTRDRVELLRRCVHGLLSETDYEPVEIIIVDNDSAAAETRAYLSDLSREKRVRVLGYPGAFNYSAINNFAVAQARYPLIGLLNNDISVIHRDWLREMASHAVRPEIGAVGAKLYYPNDTVQHAGTILGLFGTASHAFRHFGRGEPGYFGRLVLTQNLSAVTAACMLLRRNVFDEVGGFDAVNLAVAFNDVDLCLRIGERGYRILWTPYAELYHWESASRGSDLARDTVERFGREAKYLAERWPAALARDPCYNSNLSLAAANFSLAFPPRPTAAITAAANA